MKCRLTKDKPPDSDNHRDDNTIKHILHTEVKHTMESITFDIHLSC